MEKVNPDFKIRDAGKSDMESVHRIFNEILLNTTATFDEDPYSIQTWLEIFEARQLQNLPFIIVEVHGAVVGYGTFGPFRKASGYKITVEHSLHIDKQYRGQGLGKAILTELIKRATQLEFQNMIAAVDADNTSSVRLHEKFGFVQVGKLENVAKKFSRDLTLILMQLSLNR